MALSGEEVLYQTLESNGPLEGRHVVSRCVDCVQGSFPTTLFLTDLEMNGPVGRQCAVSLDMPFLEVFYTTLSLNKHLNRQFVAETEFMTYFG
jgi:hypothetical protein